MDGRKLKEEQHLVKGESPYHKGQETYGDRSPANFCFKISNKKKRKFFGCGWGVLPPRPSVFWLRGQSSPRPSVGGLARGLPPPGLPTYSFSPLRPFSPYSRTAQTIWNGSKLISNPRGPKFYLCGTCYRLINFSPPNHKKTNDRL